MASIRTPQTLGGVDSPQFQPSHGSDFPWLPEHTDLLWAGLCQPFGSFHFAPVTLPLLNKPQFAGLFCCLFLMWCYGFGQNCMSGAEITGGVGAGAGDSLILIRGSPHPKATHANPGGVSVGCEGICASDKSHWTPTKPSLNAFCPLSTSSTRGTSLLSSCLISAPNFPPALAGTAPVWEQSPGFPKVPDFWSLSLGTDHRVSHKFFFLEV